MVEISAEETHPLRLAVLRATTTSKQVVFPEDDFPGVVHLGVSVEGELVAVSTWVPRPHHDQAAVQLRGMATAARLQGTGLGGLLLESGCRRALSADLHVVWANARDTALPFYLQHGFRVEGDGFLDATIGLPHHRVVRNLAP